MKLTLAQWFALDDAGRSVVVDQLIERVPPGYIEPRSVGHAPKVLPQFIHQETNMLFNVVFGGSGVMGMTDARFKRVQRVEYDIDDDDQWGLAPAPQRDELMALSPGRSIEVGAALVCDMTLPFGVLKKLGLDESRLSAHGLSPLEIGALQGALARLGWRAPSEAEWEFVCRSVDDSVDDAPVLTATGRLAGIGLEHMGSLAELCRDSWNDAGEQHQVLRGRGGGDRFVGWHASQSWAECVWPGRHQLAQWRDSVAIRPWVDLR